MQLFVALPGWPAIWMVAWDYRQNKNVPFTPQTSLSNANSLANMENTDALVYACCLCESKNTVHEIYNPQERVYVYSDAFYFLKKYAPKRWPNV